MVEGENEVLETLDSGPNLPHNMFVFPSACSRICRLADDSVVIQWRKECRRGIDKVGHIWYNGVVQL